MGTKKLHVVGFFTKTANECYLKDDVDLEIEKLKSTISLKESELRTKDIKINRLEKSLEDKIKLLETSDKSLNECQQEALRNNEVLKRNRELREKLVEANENIEKEKEKVSKVKEEKKELTREHTEAISKIRADVNKTTRANSKAAADAILKADKADLTRKLKEENKELKDKLTAIQKELDEVKSKRTKKIHSDKFSEEQLSKLLDKVSPKPTTGKRSFSCNDIKIIRKVNSVDKVPPATIAQFLEVGNSIISRIVNYKTYTDCK